MLNERVYRQFQDSPPRTPVRRPDTETLANRRSRIRKRAGIIFYEPKHDPATLTRAADPEVLEEHRRLGVQVGAAWVAHARGIDRR